MLTEKQKEAQKRYKDKNRDLLAEKQRIYFSKISGKPLGQSVRGKSKLSPEERQARNKQSKQKYNQRKREELKLKPKPLKEKKVKIRTKRIPKVKKEKKVRKLKTTEYQRNACKLRYAAMVERTPKWLSREDLNKIKEIYKEANRKTREEGITYHVDHIIPLRGRKVSGLHIPENLQIIPASVNFKKSNRGNTWQLDHH